MVAKTYYYYNYYKSEWDYLICSPLPKERDLKQLELDLQIPSELDSYRDQAINLWFKDGSCTGGRSE